MKPATIIGAGPGGIAASIYLRRAGIDPLLLEQGEPGGLLRSANLVENYPGFPGGIAGQELASIFVRQLEVEGLRPARASVETVRGVDGGFEIRSGSATTMSAAVIIATGTRPRRIAMGEEGLEGGRLFYDIGEAIGSGHRRFIIIGGGDAAFDYAINLHDRGMDPIIVSRSPLKCLSLLQDRVERRRIAVEIGLFPERALGSPDGIVLVARGDGGIKEIRGDALIIACGRVPNLEILEPRLRDAAQGTPPGTGVPGLFLVGDVARGRRRQTGIAVGDGILAAMMVEDYLSGLRERP